MVNPVIKKQQLLTRGRIAKLLNVHPETLRYYEAEKLISKPTRLSNNYRVYHDEDIEKIKFILMAKELNFTIREIRELLELFINNKNNKLRVRKLAQEKSILIHQKIKQLTRLKKALDKLIVDCKSSTTNDNCPILTHLKRK